MEMVDWMDGEDDDPCEVSWFWYGWIMVNMETTDNDSYVVEIDCYLVHRLNSVFLYCSIIVRRVVSTMRRLYLFFWIKHDDGYTNNRKNKILLLVLRDNLCYCLFHSPFLSLSRLLLGNATQLYGKNHTRPREIPPSRNSLFLLGVIVPPMGKEDPPVETQRFGTNKPSSPPWLHHLTQTEHLFQSIAERTRQVDSTVHATVELAEWTVLALHAAQNTVVQSFEPSTNTSLTKQEPAENAT